MIEAERVRDRGAGGGGGLVVVVVVLEEVVLLLLLMVEVLLLLMLLMFKSFGRIKGNFTKAFTNKHLIKCIANTNSF